MSFAFFDRENKPEAVSASCRQSLRVIEWLAENGQWDAGRLFTVNVPLKEEVETQKVVWTKVLQNAWTGSSCFEETPGVVEDPQTEEAELRKQESKEGGVEKGSSEDDRDGDLWKPHHFKWAPKFKDVFQSVQDAGPGSDGWAVKEGQTSITALRANFEHINGFSGEVKL